MPSNNDGALPSPPRAPTVKYSAPHGTRWDKEKAAAGGARAFDLPSDPKVLGPWIIGECVGKGASGRVKIAKHRYTNQLAAVKILPRAPLDSSRNSIATQEAKSKKHSLGIEREITMMKLMNHPNILRIYDVYEGPKELFLVLEYVEGGELFDYLVNRGRLPEPDAICFFKQIIYGLNYAHTFSIIHRDLKPENILISSLSPPKIKIVDWGMAAFAPPTLQLETSCGSPHYASPEIVNGFKYTGNATDIWSCGVILYALLTGRLPFDDKDVKLLLGKVKVGKYDMPSYIDRSAQDLLSKMLVINVEERITIPEILAHPWLNTSPAALRQMSLASSFENDSPLEPVLPPSPSTLARPITDPSSIDSDILFSLKVIWGRHADLAAIVKDLGSPAGNGVYTKAFYWLLLRHHEEAERLSGSDENNDENTSATGMGPGSVTFNLGWELDTSGLGGATVKFSSAARAIEVGRVLGPERRGYTDTSLQAADGLLSPLMTRDVSSTSSSHASRSRPNTPGGPRLPTVPRPTYERNSSQYTGPHSGVRSASGRSSSLPKSSFAMGNGGGSGIRASSVVNGTQGGPRPQPPKRGHTYSHPRPDKPSAMTTRSNKSPDAISVSTVQFPPTPIHPLQYTQSHRSVSRSSRPRSVTTVDVTTEASRPHLQARSRSHTSQVRGGYIGGTSLKRATSSVHSGTNSSSGSSTTCSITSTATVHAPIPMKAVSGVFEVPMEVDDNSSMQIASTPPPLLPPLVYPLPLLTAPRTNDPALQMELDEVAEHMNRLSLQNAVAETTAQSRQAAYQQQRFQSPKRNRRRTVSTVERGARCADKENKENASINDESWSYVVPDEGLSTVSGKKNALFADTGNHKRGLGANDGKGKRDKDKKPRPPPLEFTPLNHKRSTTSALGSPIALSPPAINSTSTKAGLGSPVVGEFKGWLSSLFSWSVKFRIELTSIGDEGDSGTFPSSPVTPLSNGHHLFPSAGASGVRGRSSTLGGGLKSPHLPSSPLLSPNYFAGSVHGFLSALIVIQEKGSASTFKAIWKKLKDVYDDGDRTPSICLIIFELCTTAIPLTFRKFTSSKRST
ncbi:CAMK CAMKL GIN4 protein kinase [Lentinula edodes]|uniref:CAMK CAMKL GIN4 protein kinase n=2 Tax=Lentinula TaxID=5352 RepID=A0A1Q3E8G7_LENED|nr:CAMK CAMKL GIN4 protein kinase [Lentinula edodes]